MLLGSRNNLKLARQHRINLKVSVISKQIKRVVHYNYLGVIMDPTLSWELHIHNMLKKVSSRLGLLKRIKYCLNSESVKLLYNSMIQPLYDYCDVVWSNSGNKLMDRVQKMQNKGARLLLI